MILTYLMGYIDIAQELKPVVLLQRIHGNERGWNPGYRPGNVGLSVHIPPAVKGADQASDGRLLSRVPFETHVRSFYARVSKAVIETRGFVPLILNHH